MKNLISLLTSQNFLYVFSCFLLIGTCSQLAAQAPEGQILLTDPTTGKQYYAQAHEVAKGESLYALQRKYGIKVAEIKRLNQLTSDLIWPGQVLAVSQTGTTQRKSTQLSRSHSLYEQYSDKPFDAADKDPQYPSRLTERLNTRGNLRMAEDTELPPKTQVYDPGLPYYHEVQAGENLNQIADRFGISVQEIKERNGIVSVVDGQTVFIPPRDEAYVSSGEGEDLEEDEQFDFVYKNSEDPVKEWEDETWEESTLFASSEGANQRTTATEDQALPRGPAGEIDLEPGLLLTENSGRALGAVKENGRYGQYVGNDPADSQFYGLHKELKKGDVVKMMIPNTSGYVEVQIIGTLPANSDILIALSSSGVELLRKAGAGNMVTIFHD